ncbi:MAG: hypothetical protein VX895_00370, partial [Chloroflexota bacterium]|nr:hypothetical protein [Chloroflexota bacterium]
TSAVVFSQHAYLYVMRGWPMSAVVADLALDLLTPNINVKQWQIHCHSGFTGHHIPAMGT